jgi:tRNA pseudouridine38-40 synthase
MALTQNYAMILRYDGTRYSGWQKQGNTENSIQSKVENVLSRMCGKRIEVSSSGRTDAGVHALNQCVSFRCDTDKSPDEIRDYMNEYLPKDIGVMSVKKADDRFHARLSAKKKTYLYRIQNSPVPNVFERNYVYCVPEKLDVPSMRASSEYLCGEHDFKAFCSLKKTKKSTVRTIYEIKIEDCDGEIRIYVTGSGFLYNMVRIIVGTLIEVGRGERKPEDVMMALESLDRQNAGYTAPPEGLIMIGTEY